MSAIDTSFPVRPIGHVESPLKDRAVALKQGHEGSPIAWLVFDAAFREGLSDLQVGDDIIVLTWLDRGRRNLLRVYPRGDPTKAKRGVFSTRSPDRPNPIGLHRVKILSTVDVLRVEVQNLEPLDLTPIIDVKPVLKEVAEA